MTIEITAAARPVGAIQTGAWRRLRRTSGFGLLVCGALIVGGIGLLVAFPPLFGLSHPDAVDYNALMSPPSSSHLFGTDNLGRDMLSRVAYGGRIDLLLGVSVTVASLLIGMAIGTVVGFYRGVGPAAVMRLVDVLLSVPFVVIVLSIVAIIGPGIKGVIIGMLVVSWTIYARITASEMLVLRERQFILAARTLGFSDRRIILRHAMPNLFRPNIAFSMSDVVGNILALASLSYLGVGVQPPTPEWGSLIASGQQYLLNAWWISTMPGLVIVVVGLGLSLIGEWLSIQFGVKGLRKG